jgi:hypothetical protein
VQEVAPRNALLDWKIIRKGCQSRRDAHLSELRLPKLLLCRALGALLAIPEAEATIVCGWQLCAAFLPSAASRL